MWFMEVRSKNMAKIGVLEILGARIEGEGGVMGGKRMFVGRGGCDYGCSWCD